MNLNSSAQELLAVIVICGPTASGKTALSLQISKDTDIEIISADSRQIYKHLDIGTAKPSLQELKQVKHHLVDFLQLDEAYNAAQFGHDAEQIIAQIHNKNKLPVIVGGSGLYIKSACEGLFDESEFLKDESILKQNGNNAQAVRAVLETELKTKGIDILYGKLKEVDLELYNLYQDKNPRRVIRALEFFYVNNVKLSDAWRLSKSKRRVVPKYFCIDFDRDTLYDRINKRTEMMWENGLVKETENILNLGYSPSLNSLNTVGYKETISYLRGEITQDTAIEEIKKNTRHYAKRQITWFKKVPGINWIKPEDFSMEAL